MCANGVINGPASVWEQKAFQSGRRSGPGYDISTSCLIISYSVCANELELRPPPPSAGTICISPASIPERRGGRGSAWEKNKALRPSYQPDGKAWPFYWRHFVMHLAL